MQSIRPRSFSGEDETRFAKVYFKREDLTLLMRKSDLAETVRTIISAREARKLLKHLETCEGQMSSQWKARANQNEAGIESGDPYEFARVYKGLAQMQAEGESLRAADRKHLQISFEFLAEELAAALDKPRANVEKLIHKRVGLSDNDG